ncbi:MAG: cation:proton antiporter [Deltaproteobacteria bacterium]|jgi:Kef-type K+ transport system membrane component KefB|nr:cation:proton antiporter [Deltaproteobacteria bacterium]
MDIILSLLLILILSKCGGWFALKLKQSEVLGELIIGMLVGNLMLFGIEFSFFDFLKHNDVIEVLSQIGIVFLLFSVGLEIKFEEMLHVGLSALLVALLGVLVPFGFGWGVAVYFVPEAGILAHIFVGATLTATSVGISVRVLQELKVLKFKESKIILGAAVLDDILGLVVLAIVTGLVSAHNANVSLDYSVIVLILAKALGFIVTVLLAGKFLIKPFFNFMGKLTNGGNLCAACLIQCFGFAYLADLVGLAPIVGAFFAGLIINEEDFKIQLNQTSPQLVAEDYFKPLLQLFVPIFFLSMGAKVDLSIFADTSVLFFALILTVMAILGKQFCGLGVLEKGVDRIAVGLGMIPRGEVGLIFISIGSKLLIDGQAVINSQTFSAVVMVVVLTTIVTPIMLRRRFLKLSLK